MSGDEVYLRHVLEAIEAIEEDWKVVTRESLESDRRTRSAIVRELEVIGEAAKHLSEEFRVRHPEIPVQEMAGMRDHLIHEYFGVDLNVVWKTVTEDLPLLKASIRKLLGDR